MDNIEITLIDDREYILEEMEEWMDKYNPLCFKNEEVYKEKLLNKLNEVLDEVLD